MKAISLALCCLALPITHAAIVEDAPDLPKQFLTPNVRFDQNPIWVRDELKANKKLDINKLTFPSLIAEAIRTKVEQCVLKAEDKAFLLDPKNNQKLKIARWEKVWTENYAKLWSDLPNRKYNCDFKNYLSKLFEAQSGNINEQIDKIVKIYTDFGSIRVNQKLHEGKAEDQLAYALLLNDILRNRLMVPYGHSGKVFRGTRCNLKKLQGTIGEIIDVDFFASFSKKENISRGFAAKAGKKGDLEPCLITLDIQKGETCGVDLRDYSHLTREAEVLTPFSAKVKMVSIAPPTKENAYASVVWSCAEKANVDSTKITAKFKASMMLHYDEK